MKIHNLQQHILAQLAANPGGSRYRDMKPAEVENDRYNYHLQHLVTRQLVEKQAERYLLTESGKKYIIDPHPLDVTGKLADQFKLAALCLVARKFNDTFEVLYQTRKCQPFAGNRELIGGGINKGELAIDAARRRLFEEAGLVADFKLLGLIRKIRRDRHNQLYGDILFHLCLADTCRGGLIAENKFGKHEWVPIDEVIANESTASYGSKQLANVLRAIKGSYDLPPMFYIEESYMYDIY